MDLQTRLILYDIASTPLPSQRPAGTRHAWRSNSKECPGKRHSAHQTPHGSCVRRRLSSTSTSAAITTLRSESLQPSSTHPQAHTLSSPKPPTQTPCFATPLRPYTRRQQEVVVHTHAALHSKLRHPHAHTLNPHPRDPLPGAPFRGPFPETLRCRGHILTQMLPQLSAALEGLTPEQQQAMLDWTQTNPANLHAFAREQ